MGVRGDMEPRGSLYRTRNGESSMVYNAQVYNAPLLPFEKHLIETIGATEEEYRYLVNEALKKSRIRPAGYEHIPDIRCDPGSALLTQFLISLAVGVTLSVVTYLLTPKPKQPKAQERRELESINNAGRFSPTFGFDSQAELATYGEPIPIIFGRYDETEKIGGVLASPKLVWSRMFSEGSQQSVKMAFIVGEQGGAVEGLGVPDLSGIFIGNNPLDAIYQNSFEFYWVANSREGSGSRIFHEDSKYGQGDIRTTGNGDTVLLCPTAQGNRDTGFSASYSLSNNSDFGCYAAIPNGSVYRVNWVHVSMIDKSADSDPLAWQRIKIAGTYSRGDDTDIGKKHDHLFHTDGTGRNYSRRMGITQYHRGGVGVSPISASNSDVVKTIDNVQIGDVCQFHITKSSEKLREDLYHTSVKVDDINSEIDSQRAAADDALQIGEVFQIGTTVWQVFNRDHKIWTDANDVRQVAWLKCIDNNGGVNNRIGIVSDGVLSPTKDKGYGDGWVSDTLDPRVENEPGAGFYPLLRTSKALLKNTRSCETTEIGIRSRVSQDLQGLCNFQSLLSPKELHDLEDDKVQVQSGTITTSIKRASLFTLKYRDTETVRNTSGADVADWKDFGVLFAVIGSTAVDQYNWIRARHPSKNKYEFKITPVAGATLKDKSDSETVYRLSAQGTYHSIAVVDGFRLEFGGETTNKGQIKMNKEFTNRATLSTASVTTSGPSAVSQDDYITGKEDWDNISRMTQSKWIGNYGGTGSGDVGGYGRGSAFTWEIFGNASSASENVGDTKTVTETFTTTGNKPVKLALKAIRTKLDPVPSWMSGTGATHTWVILGATDVTVDRLYEGVQPDLNQDASNNLDWSPGQKFKIQKTCGGSNPWAQNAENGALTYAGIEVEVTGHDYIHNVTRGKWQGFLHEVFGNAESQNVNDIKDVQIKLTVDSSMDADNSSNTGWKTNIKASESRTLTVKFKGKVINIRPNWTGRTNGWECGQIDVVASTGTWTQEERIEFFRPNGYAYSNNPFWRSIQKELGINLKIDNIETTTTGGTVEVSPTLEGARIFEAQSQYSDLSIYGPLVRKSNESSPEHTVVYVNEQLTNGESYPTYGDLTTACLMFNASRNFTGLDQVRVWLRNGVPVERLHPDEGSATGPSNLFTDLTYYLLTNRTGGAGRLLGTETSSAALIDRDQLVETSKFLQFNKLFYNGALFSAVNLRSYLSEAAPNFLCDFILLDGKLSLKPAVPVDSSGQISLEGVEIKQLFTSGNILEDTFKISYIDAAERTDVRMVVRYREEKQNQLPEEKTVTVRKAGGDGSDIAVETIDLTQFCTSKKHAQLVGKFYLSLRHQVKHTCSFKTTPYGLDLAPGDYIRVTTESSPYNAANNGSVSASGVITSVTNLNDGIYNVLYYKTTTNDSDVEEASMQVSNGSVTDSKFHSSIFSILSTTNKQNVYRVEQLTLDQDNTVDIVASEFPCDSGLVSLMARELRSSDAFVDENGNPIFYHLA